MITEIAAFDVASRKLVPFRKGEKRCAIDNDKKSILAYLKELPKHTVIALEATGGYGHLLAELACKRGHTVYMLQPGKVKNYCKASPTRGKSDYKDAENIASYVLAFEGRLHPYQPLPEFESKLKRLYRKREGMADHVASLRLQMRSLGDSPKEIEAALRIIVKRLSTSSVNTLMRCSPKPKTPRSCSLSRPSNRT